MGLFGKDENRIKCGKCGTEFDLKLNGRGCPLCGFGQSNTEPTWPRITVKEYATKTINYLLPPPDLNLKSGTVRVNESTKTWGSWVMFNDFFAPKFLARALAWMISEKNDEHITVEDLVVKAKELIKENGLSELKGFPNDINNKNSVARLVYHFLATGADMGLFAVSAKTNPENVWREAWTDISIRLTSEGLEWAKLPNNVFDLGNKEQILTIEEKKWLLNYLKKIDAKGYREYSALKGVYEFVKEGHNGNRDLWEWFKDQRVFVEYIKSSTKRAKDNEKAFDKQLKNYAQSFAASKISLLRELGVIKDKRNDYTVIGELR
jgi:ribosomal protein L37E